MKATFVKKATALVLSITILVLMPFSVVNAGTQENITQYFSYGGTMYEFSCLYANSEAVLKIKESNEKIDSVYSLIESTQITNQDISAIKDYMVGRTQAFPRTHDINNDGIISIYDLIMELNRYYSNPLNYFPDESNSKIELEDFIKILEYKKSKKVLEFTVRSGDRAPTTTASTTVPKVTTPKATTVVATVPKVTTPKATTVAITVPKVTTPKATTVATTVVTTVPKVTTPKATTVATTVPKVTTPKATTVVTTVPKITTPKATTVVTTVPKVTTQPPVTTVVAPEMKVIQSVAKKMYSNVKIPAVADRTLKEEKNVYLFRIENEVYAYTMLTEQLAETNKSLLVDWKNINALHIWKYEGTEKPFDYMQSLPDTTGCIFKFKNCEYEYELIKYEKLKHSDILYIAQRISGVKKVDYLDIMMYDYNLDGVLNEQDLEIIIKSYTSNIKKIIYSSNDEIAGRYIENMGRLGHENVILRKSPQEKEFSYIVPCMDYYSDYHGATWICPVQVLPASYAEKLISEGYKEWEVTDSTRDFIIWRPQIYGKSNGASWSSVSNKMENWLFAGYYIQVLKPTGEYLEDWEK